jgi:hypothetical protein
LTHLRFTPEEYGAISALCRSIHLRDECFPIFRYFLAEALHECWPALAGRVALLGERRLRLLFRHIQQRHGQAARPERDSAEHGLSAEEYAEVARASEWFLLRGGRRSAFRAFLAHYFRAEAPALADKLARLCARQVAALYRQVRGPGRLRP